MKTRIAFDKEFISEDSVKSVEGEVVKGGKNGRKEEKEEGIIAGSSSNIKGANPN